MDNAADIITLGCRLNAAESEAMRRMADDAGIRNSVIINTCAVTNEAVRTARQRIRKARREQPESRIIVTGCAAQIGPDDFAAMPEVDHVLGNIEKLKPDQWNELAGEIAPSMAVNDIMSVRETAGHLIDGYGDRARAFLQIQNGCDHRCTFCIIPYGRGNSRSTPIDKAIEQASRLVEAGHRELVLTGVDITSWGADLTGAPTLGDLVAALLKNIPALYRLRLSSIDGAEIDEKLFDLITGEERIAPYLHLSLQSGDNMILKRMKRRHTREQAIELCQNIRNKRPETAFGADIIAGFPTETDAMFQNSLDIIDEAGLQFVHVFPFSPRNGTPAARMPQIDRRIVKDRASALRNKADAALRNFHKSLVGWRGEAIMESGGRARLGNFASVTIDSRESPVGDIVPIEINHYDGSVLSGTRC